MLKNFIAFAFIPAISMGLMSACTKHGSNDSADLRRTADSKSERPLSTKPKKTAVTTSTPPNEVWSLAYREGADVVYPARACILSGATLDANGPLNFQGIVAEPTIVGFAQPGFLKRDNVPSVASMLISKNCSVFIGTSDEVKAVVASATYLGAKMNTVNDVIPRSTVLRLYAARQEHVASLQREEEAVEARRSHIVQSNKACAHDQKCVRTTAEVMSTFACMTGWAASNRMGSEAASYQSQMIQAVRHFQQMQIAQADWSALQALGSSNSTVASRMLGVLSNPVESDVSGACLTAVQGDPQFDKLVAKATLK